MTNAIMTIAPYRHAGTWVFDDEAHGLVAEPFVSGVPEMIDYMVRDIANAESGFRMIFSANPFPGYQQVATWIREEMGGNWYRTENPEAEGWLCPALFAYFDEAPQTLYIGVEALDRQLTGAA